MGLDAEAQALGEHAPVGLQQSPSQYDNQTGRVGGNLTGTLQNQTFQFDPIGNLTNRADAVRAVSQNFQYDTLNRLTQASGDGPTLNLAYDALGNITSKSDAGAYVYGTRPHAVASISGALNTTFTYDANGNLLSGNGRAVTWSSYDQPLQITQGGQNTSFIHDFDHARVKQTAPDGTVTVYVNAFGIHYEKETKAGLTEAKHTLAAAGQTIGEYVSRSNGTSDTRYFHGDHLGSISVVSNETGLVVARYAFDPWGKRTVVSGDGTVADHGFTGHEMLDNGLVHMNGRVYDPVVGRFLSADPCIQFPDNPQDFNRYSYVLNNPLSFTDPSGYGLTDFLDKYANQLIALAVAYFAPGMLAELGPNMSVAVAGFMSGIVATGTTQGGFQSMFTAMMFKWAGDIAEVKFGGQGIWDDGGIGRTMLHAGAGCLSGVASKTGCGGGAVSAGFAEYVGGGLTKGSTPGVQFAARIVIGGTASALGGGKFANGAVMGAFGYLFNVAQHSGDTIDRRVYVAEDSEVKTIGWEDPENQHGPKGGFGFRIKLKSIEDSESLFVYAHMDPKTITVLKGQLIGQGSLLGKYADPTNGGSEAPHLHFEWWKGKVRQDPMYYLPIVRPNYFEKSYIYYRFNPVTRQYRWHNGYDLVGPTQ